MTIKLNALTDSWSANGVDAIKMNVVTNSHTGQLLTLQADNTTQFQVTQDAKIGDGNNWYVSWDGSSVKFFNQNTTVAAINCFSVNGVARFDVSTEVGVNLEIMSAVAGARQTPGGTFYRASYIIAWTNATDAISTLDTGISRSAAGVIAFGNGSAGDASACITAKTKAGAPTTSDVPAGTWALIRDTTNSTTKIYYNNGGVLQSVVLT